MANETVSKSKLTKKYGNATDTIVVTGSNNKIYTYGGNDTVTLSKGSSNVVDTGTGNDIITVNDGNAHTLRGGTGSDKYEVNSKIVRSTRLTVNQSDYRKNDADVLQLAKVNIRDVDYSLSKGTLTISHSTGGKVMISGWNKNCLAKIQFANNQYVTGKQVSNYVALKTGKVINVTKAGTYKATSSKELFRLSGFGWNATITGANSADALDFTKYNFENVDWNGFKKKGNDLLTTLVKPGKGSVKSRTATVTVKDYFKAKNKLGKSAYYDHVDDDHGLDKTTLCVLNIRYGVSGTKGDDLIQATKAGTWKGNSGNDMIMGSSGADRLFGDAGDDVISGGAGDDYLHGGAGNDELEGDAGNDYLHGGAGNDYLYDGEGNNYLYGDAGNDTIIVTGGVENDIDGGTGDDTIIVTEGVENDIKGGTGNDTISVTGGRDHYVATGGGQDTITFINVTQGYINAVDKAFITVEGGENNSIHLYDTTKLCVNSGSGHKVTVATSGSEEIAIKGGNGHEISLERENSKVSITGGKEHKLTVSGSDNTVDIAWTGGLGELSVYGGGVQHDDWGSNNTITIDCSISRFNFETNDKNLILSDLADNENTIIINNWVNESNTLKLQFTDESYRYGES